MNKRIGICLAILELSAVFMTACNAEARHNDSAVADIQSVQSEKFAESVPAESEEESEIEPTDQYIETVKSGQLDWEWVIVPGTYEDFKFLGEGLIAVKKENGKYGVIDGDGAFAFPGEYDSIGAYSEGKASVRTEEGERYIDAKGCILLDLGDTYDVTWSFLENRAAVKKNGKWGYINERGKNVIPCQYEEVGDFSEGYAVVARNGKWGYIDDEGKTVTPCQYDEARDFSGGRAAVRMEDKWGYIDGEGKTVTPCQYDEARDFSGGRVAVRMEDKWGFIDETGETAVEFLYDEVGNFSEGKAAVKLEQYFGDADGWAYIDEEGEVVIDFGLYFASSEGPFCVGEFHNGMAFVSQGELLLIDDKGNYIPQVDSSGLIFRLAIYYEDYDAIPGFAYMDEIGKTRKYGLAGSDGSCLVAPVFDWVSGMKDDFVLVAEGAKDGVIRVRDRREEGKRYLQQYYGIANPDRAYRYEYVGKEKDIDKIMGWQSYSTAYRFRILEKEGDKETFIADAWLYGGANEEDFFTRDADGVWQKHTMKIVENEEDEEDEEDEENADEYCYIFSMAYGKENMHGREYTWYHGEDMELQVTVLKNGKPYENAVVPTDYDGVYVDLSDWAMTDGFIRIRDYNFDGQPDLGIEVGSRANWGGCTTLLYVREISGGNSPDAAGINGSFQDCVSYRMAGRFMGMPSVNAEQELLYDFNRGGCGMYYYIAYAYRDGTFEPVASLDIVYSDVEGTDEESVAYRIVDEAGNIEEYTDEFPDKWAAFWGMEE